MEPWPLLFSFSGILVLWALFEFARFGKLFGGYAGETFSYPFFTGLLRLTVLPNKGLFWYAPIVLLAPFGFFELRRRDARLALACAASALSLLLTASAWWAWDGQAGWGPRLLLPALPPLLVFAGLAPSGSARPVRFAGALALVLGTGVNLLGALVPFPAVYALSSVVPPQPIPERRAEGTEYEIERGADGVLRATAPHHLSLTPSWSPIRVHTLLLAAKLRGGVAESLAREGLPQLDPPFRPILPREPAPAMLLALRPVRVGWGREYFFEREEGFSDPWADAMRDQTVRAIDMKNYARAHVLGEELLRKRKKDPDSEASNDPRIVALIAEALRLGDQRNDARVIRSFRIRVFVPLSEQLFPEHVRPRVILHVDRADGLIPHRVRPGIRKSLFPFNEIFASPPDANRPEREEHCGSGLSRQDGSERRIELRETFPRQTLRDAPPQLRRQKQRVNADRRPGGREREVMGRRRAKDAVRSALDLVLRARRPSLRDRLRRHDGRKRVDRGKRDEGAEQIHAGAEDERERSGEAHRPGGTRRRETRENEKRRQRGQQKARPPSRLPVPRPPCGRGEKERKGRRGTGECQPRIAPAELEEAERREENDRRVPEQPLVWEHRQPEEPCKEGIRERLPRIPSEELAEAREFEESPENENS